MARGSGKFTKSKLTTLSHYPVLIIVKFKQKFVNKTPINFLKFNLYIYNFIITNNTFKFRKEADGSPPLSILLY